jgi:hypothetical protein
MTALYEAVAFAAMLISIFVLLHILGELIQ